ncbi:single-stranded-DNA-specific exonuclease RecJ [Candidatus Sumerlaeota bacterium]|nr:single-stranded-DNA-specific exonuclease RecJ [Candidatus Sumerlaeota bacterium]
MSFRRVRAQFSKCWDSARVPENAALDLSRDLGLTPLAARLLAARDLSDPASVQAFLHPALASLHDPFLMRDMDRAVDRIARALSARETIGVYGDYDVDGMTSTSLLVRFFRWLGVEVLPYIPHRLNEGYGMSRKGVDQLHSAGVRLIVTVDNGIGCVDEVAHAASLGIDVVVTDHHQPGDTIPAAVAVVDPNRRDCPYPFKGLSGVGVAFKLAHALSRHLGKDPEESREFLKSHFDLVALGTIADIVPLQGENRVLAWYGLQTLANTRKQGLQAMIQMLGIDGRAMDGETVGFLLGPRLNAAGRTGEAQAGLELLLTEDETRSWDLARFLDELNDHRRKMENEVFFEVMETIEGSTLLDDPVLVVSGPNWHAGIVGIVASRLVERFGHPAFVLSIESGIAKGSARSIGRFDLHGALSGCAELLNTFGGHKMAAGLSLPADRIPALRRALIDHVESEYSPEDMEPRLAVDTDARVEELTLEALEEIGRMHPFGEGNPTPVVVLRGCRLVEAPRIVKDRHLRLRLAQDDGTNRSAGWIGAIGFSFAHRYDEIVEHADRLDIAATPKINVWQGNRSVELNLVDFRPAQTA